MSRRCNPLPVFFAQSLEVKDRQRFRRFQSIAEDMRDLLRDRSMFALGPSLQLLIKRVGKALDVQYGHFSLLLNSSIMEALNVSCPSRMFGGDEIGLLLRTRFGETFLYEL